MQIIKLAIFYGSYLMIAVTVTMALLCLRLNRKMRLFVAGGFIMSLTFLWARFIEPQLLTSKTHKIGLEQCDQSDAGNATGEIRIAVVADLHLGLFSNAMPPTRIASAINRGEPDLVLVPGDLTYHLHPEKFASAFAAFRSIRAPVMAVLGNHDVGIPGPDLTVPLQKTLPDLGVTLIDNRSTEFTADDSPIGIEIIGLSDKWQDRQDLSLLRRPAKKPRIVLTHNPNSIFDLEPDSFDLLVAGHTHGGQIYIPLLTCALIDIACSPHRYGLSQYPQGALFITSGTGMVGLPMRLNVPPRIDFLDITIGSCGT